MRLLITALALAGVSAGAVAQQAVPAPEREGFWISFGLGLGSNLSEGYANNRGGGAGYLRLGGTVTQQLLIGGEFESWVRSERNTTTSQGNATATVYFFPSVRSGLFFKSGLGFASSIVSVEQGNTTTTVTESGFGATFGGGYDIQLGDNFFVTPNLDFLVQAIEGNGGAVVLLSIGATWH